MVGDRCPWHDDLVKGQARIEAHVLGLQKQVDKLEKIITGNGSDGLLGRVTRNSIMTGAIAAVAVSVLGALLRSMM